PGAAPVELNILVGDAAAGRAYFDMKCATCHSATGDMQGIATRIPGARALQNLWVSGGAVGGRGGGGRGGRGAAAAGPEPPTGQAAGRRGPGPKPAAGAVNRAR